MMPLSPPLFLAAASALVASDVRLRRLSTEQRLEDLNPAERGKRRGGYATAAFIAHAGYTAHRQAPGKSAWPFPLDANCETLARIGLDLGVVSDEPPDAGAIYLRYSPRRRRFTRASIVLCAVMVQPMEQYGWTYDCQVIEGLGARRARRAWLTCAPELGDRFLTWVDLDGRNDMTSVRKRAA